MRTMFRSLGVVNYRTWFIGALVSNVGFWMQRTAQDWIVLTELTDHDAVAVGITTALQMAPVVLLVPLSGYISDRFDRRTVLTMTNTAMGLLAVMLGTLVITGTIQAVAHLPDRGHRWRGSMRSRTRPNRASSRSSSPRSGSPTPCP